MSSALSFAGVGMWRRSVWLWGYFAKILAEKGFQTCTNRPALLQFSLSYVVQSCCNARLCEGHQETCWGALIRTGVQANVGIDTALQPLHPVTT
eukprot:1136287-Pelagomonas_calceolata.AAC.3